MSNLMSMLYTGVSGIFAAQTQISVTGHNLANIDNPDYTRQRANLSSISSRIDRQGAFGRGVKVDEVIRTYDNILAKTVRNESTSLSYWKNNQSALSEIIVHFNELEEGSGLGTALKNYFNSWQELANIPPDNSDESYIKRAGLLEHASQLASQIRDGNAKLEKMKDNIDVRLKSYVQDINNISASIADLNKNILAIENTGQNANDLMDARDALLNELSTIVGTNVVERPNGQVAVFISGQAIVDGNSSYKLEARPNADNDNHYDIVWSSGEYFNKGTVLTDRISGGRMHSDLTMRDEIINKYQSKLDELARGLIYETNKVHSSGQGLQRHSSLISSNSVPNPAYLLDSVHGHLPYDIQRGTFQVVVYDDDGQIAGTYDIPVDPSKDNLHGIAEKIAQADGNLGGGNIDAYVNADGQLQISTKGGYTFAFGDDTSGLLVATGFNNFFEGVDASTIDVDKFIKDNPQYVSTSSAGVPGDNGIAMEMVEVKFSNVMGNGDGESGITIDEFYGYFVGKLASEKQQVDIFVHTKQMSFNQYNKKLQSITGVSMEEEQLNLVQFQRVFEANSRYINVVDAMLNEIVNNFGLVGR